MTADDDRQGRQPAVVALQNLVAQVRDQAALSVVHDIDAGAARLAAWMSHERAQRLADWETDSVVLDLSSGQLPARRGLQVRLRTLTAARVVARPAGAPAVWVRTRYVGRRRPRVTENLGRPLGRDAVRLTLPGVSAEMRVGPAVGRVARRVAEAVVAVVALLHDTRLSVIVIGTLGCGYLLMVALATVVAVVHPSDIRRDDGRRVLQFLIGQRVR